MIEENLNQQGVGAQSVGVSNDADTAAAPDAKPSYFPLVGAKPVQHADAAPYDARWRVVNTSGHLVATGDAGLADVSVELRLGYLVLKAPGMLRLDVPLDVIEDDPSVMETVELDGRSVQVVDEGAWAAQWFSQVLGRPVRLLKVC